MDSGFASAGVDGGDGKIIKGDPSAMLSTRTSLDMNFNSFGYVLTEDSPAMDEEYTPNPDFPAWDFFVDYRMRVDASVFGDVGFGDVLMEMVHASPSKYGKGFNTVEVIEKECPPVGEPSNPFPNCEGTTCIDRHGGEECFGGGECIVTNPADPTGDENNPDGSGGGGTPDDPNSGGETPPDQNCTSGGCLDPPTDGASCQSSSDCGAGMYCSEAGACTPNL